MSGTLHLSTAQLLYLHRVLAERVEPCPVADSIRRAVRVELNRDINTRLPYGPAVGKRTGIWQ